MNAAPQDASRTRHVVLTWSAATLAAVIAVASVVLTNASWRDAEWSHAAVSVLDCDAAGAYATRGAGRLLGGELLGTDLDSIAALEGLTVTNDGVSSTPTPPTATSLGNDAYANPVEVTALSSISASLGGLLTFPVDTDAGVLNQYGRAAANGQSAGAAGMVNDSGAIDPSLEPSGPGTPTFATIELGDILSSQLGSGAGGGVTNLTGVRLAVGVVAATATLDACAARWSGDVYGSLVRDYYIAGLVAELDSPLATDLAATVNAVVAALDADLTAAASDTTLLANTSGAVTTALTPLLGTLEVTDPSTTIALDANLTALDALLSTPIEDAGGIVSIDLATGIVRIDTAALFDQTNGLNNQAPNTPLLLNASVINALTAAVESALSDWTSDVITAAQAALDATNVTATTTLSVVGPTGTVLGTLSVGLDAPLNALLDGSAPVTASFVEEGGACTTLPAACADVDTLVATIGTSLPATLGPAVASLVATPVDAASTTALAALDTNLQAITAPLVTMLGDSLGFLFGADAVLSVVLNAQNAPDPSEDVGHPEPSWAGSLPGFVADPYATGRYDVAAVRVVGIGALSGGLALDLARASVGSNSPT